MNFHQVLMQQRKSLGMSQEELAERVQVSRQAVSKWENGDAQPDMTKLIVLADALELPLDTLCGRECSVSAPECANDVPVPIQPSVRRPWLTAVLVALALVCGLVVGRLLPSGSVDARAPLPDTIPVTGIRFSCSYPNTLTYDLTTGAYHEDYTYQLIFSSAGYEPKVFDVACFSGVCSGQISLENRSYDVTLAVFNGEDTRSIALASDLSFAPGLASWTPSH